jgi:hypothetical protein
MISRINNQYLGRPTGLLTISGGLLNVVLTLSTVKSVTSLWPLCTTYYCLDNSE